MPLRDLIALIRPPFSKILWYSADIQKVRGGQEEREVRALQ